MNLLFPKLGKAKKRKNRTSAEQANWDNVRQEARRLSGGYCQNPFCGYSYHYVGQRTPYQCGVPLDACHIQPVNWGGLDIIENIINLCRMCHDRVDGRNIGDAKEPIAKNAGNKFMRAILAWYEKQGKRRWSPESIEWLDKRIGG